VFRIEITIRYDVGRVKRKGEKGNKKTNVSWRDKKR
jgi:hypothetical protein